MEIRVALFCVILGVGVHVMVYLFSCVLRFCIIHVVLNVHVCVLHAEINQSIHTNSVHSWIQTCF